MASGSPKTSRGPGSVPNVGLIVAPGKEVKGVGREGEIPKMTVLEAIKPGLLEVCWCSCRPTTWRLCWAEGFYGSSNVLGTVSWRMEPVRVNKLI